MQYFQIIKSIILILREYLQRGQSLDLCNIDLYLCARALSVSKGFTSSSVRFFLLLSHVTAGQLNTSEHERGGGAKCACMFAQTCLLSDKQEQHTEVRVEETKYYPNISPIPVPVQVSIIFGSIRLFLQTRSK